MFQITYLLFAKYLQKEIVTANNEGILYNTKLQFDDTLDLGEHHFCLYSDEKHAILPNTPKSIQRKMWSSSVD